ncbi:MAG: inositol monophosphatase [Simkania negevensis]|nr:inositol monophosphatase [Simkania negevensis]
MVATLAALKAGEMLKGSYGTEMKVESKQGKRDLVTEWDRKAEAVIIELIKSHFPEHGFLAEESGASGENKEGLIWIIDPLDGTVNFANKIPIFSVSIAVAFQSEILAGVVYHPLLHELFIAEKGQGAYLNGKKINVTKGAVLDSAILATGLPYNVHENPLKCLELFTYFAKLGIPLRRCGSAALDLSYVAAGRFDGFWEVTLNPWDYAAGKLLIEEAGGMVTNFDGEELQKIGQGPILASNGMIHKQLTDSIQTVLKA